MGSDDPRERRSDAVLQQPVTPRLLEQLAGVLPPAAHARAVTLSQVQLEPSAWRRFAGRQLAGLGVAGLLAATAIFFAYNWSAMGRGLKFGLLQAAIAALSLLGIRLGVRRRRGQLALAAAAFLAGPLLAVFGQVYQTGADLSWLFVGWSVAILPFALAADTTALWLMLLAVANLASGYAAGEWLAARGCYSGDALVISSALATTNGLAWTLAELRARLQGRADETGDAPHRILPRVAAIATLAPLTVAFFQLVMWNVHSGYCGPDDQLDVPCLPAIAAASVGLAIVLSVYRRRIADIVVLGAIVFCVGACLTAIGIRAGIALDLRKQAMLTTIGALILVLGVAGALWLRAAQRDKRYRCDSDG